MNNKNNKNNNNNAFTLIELSIVLIIIGMIVGGIIGGKALIHTSELNSIITDVNGFQAAFNNYQMQYDALPGDHKNAYDYFDGSGGSAVCGTNADTTTTSGAGCNGNGNNEIDNDSEEIIRAWQHLTLAKLLPGSYTGVKDGTNYVSPNVNAPSSKIRGGGYHLMTVGSTSNSFYTDNYYAGHVVTLGKAINSTYNTDALLSPPDAQTIDKKMDNGKADSGKVVSRDGYNVTDKDCATWIVETQAPAPYNLSNTNAACRMLFVLGK